MSSGPHIPMTTSAGHFLSMQPHVEQGTKTSADKLWYRGDEFESVRAARDKFERACDAIWDLFDDGEEDLDAILDIVQQVRK